MKRFFLTLITIAVASVLFAQAPQAFKYQAIARNEAGNILSVWDISLRVSLIQEGADGKVIYTETHRVQTNIYGLINLIIGEGNVVSGDFRSINWRESRHYIKMEMDLDGGENYKEVGISQLYAVPYALYAEQAGQIVGKEEKQSPIIHTKAPTKPSRSGGSRNGTPNSKLPADTNSFLNVNVGNVGIGTTDPQEKLDVLGKIMATEGYNTYGGDGLTALFNIVSNQDFVSLKVKYRTLIFSGGILTYISDTSAWADTVGNYMLPVFGCGDLLIDSRDARMYETVLIGTQCWMADNINIGSRIDGVGDHTDNGIIDKYCYDDNESNCDLYGGLYQWNEAMDYVITEGAQGICPDGWHIPTDGEWTVLTTYLGGEGVAGGKMKSTGTIETGTGLWYAPNTDATNESGFTCLPAGRRLYTDGSFDILGLYARFWTSTKDNVSPSNALFRVLGSNIAGVISGSSQKTYGYPVRCLKDNE